MTSFNSRNMPAGWRIQTGLNPDFVISTKMWAKECGQFVAVARKKGSVDAAIKALTEGRMYKTALKNASAEPPNRFVYDPDGVCRYVIQSETITIRKVYDTEQPEAEPGG